METKINIAEILKDKPKGIKLYSSIFGKVTYVNIHLGNIKVLCPELCYKCERYFYNDGKFHSAGESVLFPSKEMRDWNKFSWKKGDVLSCGVDNLCIFEKWANKEYTEFYAKFVTPNYSGNTFKTEKWSKETNESVIKQYISNIEEFKGGKLNLTTWDSEKKKVVNLKPKYNELKPFDKVVVRCSKADRWSIDFFSYKVSNGYICTGDTWFGYCLPYNEETAKLVGTTNNVEG